MEGVGKEIENAKLSGLFNGGAGGTGENGDTECECPECASPEVCAGAFLLLLLPLFIKNLPVK